MAQILDMHGNPIQTAQLREPQTARLAALHREFSNHPSRGLTPAKLARILEEAEQGNLQSQAELFADMEEKDAHLFAEMDKRKRALIKLDWSIEPPQNASAAEKSDAGYLTEMLDSVDLPDLSLSLMDGVGYGYRCTEINWSLIERQQVPVALEHRPPSWFRTSAEEQNTLRLRDNSPTGAALIPFGWVCHVHKAKSGYIARGGLHRVLAWPYLFKNYGIRDFAEYLEICGIPIRVGKYPAGTGAAERATLLRAVTELGHAAAGIIPDSMMIEFITAAQNGAAPHMTMVEWAERSMSKAILGGTLTSQADGKTSTNALGTVHNEVRRELTESDARQVAATITRDLLYPLLVLNRGQRDPRRIPKLVFDVSEPEDMKTFADSLPKLVGIGMQIPSAWAQKKLGIPAPAKDEPVLGAPQASAQPQGKTALAALAAATASQQAGNIPAVQIADRLDVETAAAWMAVIGHVEQMAAAAGSLEELQATILTAYGSLPQADLRKVLAQGIALAHLSGLADVMDGN